MSSLAPLVLSRPHWRALTYPALVLSLCLLPLDSKMDWWLSYLARDNNALNLYMVKLGWAWTLIAASLLLLSNLKTNYQAFFRLMCRWAMATAVWFVWTNLFVLIWERTGVCGDGSNPELNSIRLCKKAKLRWGGGFDASGHTFLMVWNNLFLLEEAQIIDSDLNSYIVIPCAIMVCLWDLMLVSTSLFFHSVPEKVAGLAAAISTWFLLYKLVYTRTGFKQDSGQRKRSSE